MNKIQIKSIDNGITGKKQLPVNLILKNRFGVGRWILIIIFAFIFGGFGGVLADRYLFPYLLTFPQFEKYRIFQPRNEKIIIKKEEKEDENITEENFNEIIRKIRLYTVGIAPTEELKNFFGRIQKLDLGGQGVILTSDGIILTTRAVVKKQDKFLVVFSDGKNYETDNIFFDPASDLVFLKVNAKDLSAVEIADFENLFLGQNVLILNDLFINNEESISIGTIENLNKKENFLLQNEKLDSFISLTGKFDKFSRGGPVFSKEGKLIGVIKKIGEKTEIIAGRDIKKPLSDLIKKEKITRVKLGIKYFFVTPDFAYFKNLQKSYGIFLPQYSVREAVERDSPAEKAGILPGDLIYEIDGQEIKGSDTYFRLIQEKEPNSKIKISFLRKNREYKTEAVLKDQVEKQK